MHTVVLEHPGLPDGLQITVIPRQESQTGWKNGGVVGKLVMKVNHGW